jgi:hypothetical protein
MSYDLRHRIHALRNSGKLSSEHNNLEAEIQEYLKNGGEFAKDYYINHIGREFNKKLSSVELDNLIQGVHDSSFRPDDLADTSHFIIQIEGDNGIETGGGAFTTGTSISIQATPNLNYLFKNWEVIGTGSFASSTSKSTQFTVGTSHSKIIAHYTAMPTKVDVLGPNGTHKGSGTYIIDDMVNLSAQKIAGHKFKKWVNQSLFGYIVNPYWEFTSFKVGASPSVVVAEYETIDYDIKVSGLGSQTEGGIYNIGDTLSISAASVPGHEFTEWGLSGVGNLENKFASTTNFTVSSGPCKILAKYKKSITLLNITGGNGSETGFGQYQSGESFIISCAAKPGYKFEKWVINSGEGSIRNDTYENTIFTMGNSSADITATYTAIDYNITTSTRRELDNNPTNNYLTKTVSNVGDTINVTADSLTGFNFNKWIVKGEGTISSPSSQSTTFLVGAGSAEVYPSYSKILYNIRTSSSNGTEAGSGFFEYLGTPGLTANPNPGYAFLNWSSSDAGTIMQPSSPSTTFQVSSSDALIIANYQAIDYTLTLTGNNGSSTGAGTYKINDVVSITATPNPGYLFQRWELTGPGILTSSNSRSTSIVVGDGDCTIEAIYKAINYTISINGSNGIESGGGTYNTGDSVGIEAKPESGYEFTSWSSSGPGTILSITSAKTKFTVGSGDSLITANYTAIDYNISIIGPNGTQPGSGVNNIGDTISLAANPNPGYKFVSWSKHGPGLIADTSVPLTTLIVGAGHVTVIAVYELINYSINVKGLNGIQTGSGVYNTNDVVSITSTPGPGYEFTSWSITGQGSVDSATSPSTKFTVSTGDCTIEAIYTLIDYSISTVGLNGTETPGPGAYNTGDIVNITATPNTGYLFHNWSTSGDGYITDPSSDDTNYLVNTSDSVLTANYKAINYLINFNSVNGVANSPGAYTINSNINLLATADSGYEFVSWTKSGAGTITNSSSASTQFTVGDGDCEISAIYNPINYTVTVNGSKGSGAQGGVFNINNTVALTTKPDLGQKFSHWSLSGAGVISNSSMASTVFIAGAGDAIITANYLAI